LAGTISDWKRHWHTAAPCRLTQCDCDLREANKHNVNTATGSTTFSSWLQIFFRFESGLGGFTSSTFRRLSPLHRGSVIFPSTASTTPSTESAWQTSVFSAWNEALMSVNRTHLSGGHRSPTISTSQLSNVECLFKPVWSIRPRMPEVERVFATPKWLQTWPPRCPFRIFVIHSEDFKGLEVSAPELSLSSEYLKSSSDNSLTVDDASDSVLKGHL
jgi:hypothetical protein